MLRSYYRSTGYLLILFILFNLTITCIFSYILFKNANVDSGSPTSMGVLPSPVYFFVAVILVPVVETYIYQHLIIEKVIKVMDSKIIAILISASVFGLMHTYSTPYILKCTINGLSYGIAYVIFKSRNNHPVTSVAIIHAAHNFTGFLIDAFL